MSRVYISGPVVRQSPAWDLPPWVETLYKQLHVLLRERGHVPAMPIADAALEDETPPEFFRTIRKRIGAAKAMVNVFIPGDSSSAIEASIASVSRKKIIMVTEDPEEVPRLLKGLPGVQVMRFSDWGDGKLALAIINRLELGPSEGDGVGGESSGPGGEPARPSRSKG